MASNIHKLTAMKVQRLQKPGYYGDGGGLWLQITKSGGRSWVLRFSFNGKVREMGLGPVHTVSLAQAREKALLGRQLVLEGIDPIEERKVRRLQSLTAKLKTMSFEDCAKAYIETHRSGWKNLKHAKQWSSTLETYAFPVIGALGVDCIDTPLVLQVIEPIWLEKTETASRVRSRIELILDWATVRTYRAGENPARWKGHLDKLLPARSKVQKVQHFKALPYQEISALMTELKGRDGIAARAVEFLILTASRSGEVRGALWSEIHFEEKLWVIPAERMKAGKEHRIPLSPDALALLQSLPRVEGAAFVFPGNNPQKPLSDMSLTAVLKRMNRTDITIHGFRSTFRDWAGEMTHFPREVIEHALAHQLKDKAEAAYQRGDLLLKRRSLMQEWAKFVCSLHSSKEL